MDRRRRSMPSDEQVALRQQAIDDVLAHPEWSLRDAIRHLKRHSLITSDELARLSGVSLRAVRDIEQGRSEGTVQTVNRILGVLGLKLGVVWRYKLLD
ncbi:MAG: helix-turn-helix domain-containing protein [Betaproteobacteria bacterium]|nr:helix-turn-helix domain-containing protein [Betaproteobacteria bacterium]